MGRFEFVGEAFEDLDELFDDPLYGGWLILALFAMIFVLHGQANNPPAFQVLILYAFMVVLGVVFVVMADWKEAKERGRFLTWLAIGFVGLSGLSILANMIVGVVNGQTPQFEFLNVLETAFVAKLGLTPEASLMMLYFVGTGEETLKAFGLGLYRLFGQVGGIVEDILPAQPVTWLVVGLWSLAHVTLGQNPITYIIPTFMIGIWFMFVAQRGGTWMIPVVLHVSNNLIALVVH